MKKANGYRVHRAPGAVMVIIYKSRVLLLKRRNLPFLTNRDIWSFVTGGKSGAERYIDTAYREIEEEVSLTRTHLKPLGKGFEVWMFDRRSKFKWYNYMFIFRSDTDEIKVNYENSGYRWATFDEITKGINYTNVFINERLILNRIRSCLYGSKRSENQAG